MTRMGEFTSAGRILRRPADHLECDFLHLLEEVQLLRASRALVSGRDRLVEVPVQLVEQLVCASLVASALSGALRVRRVSGPWR